MYVTQRQRSIEIANDYTGHLGIEQRKLVASTSTS